MTTAYSRNGSSTPWGDVLLRHPADGSVGLSEVEEVRLRYRRREHADVNENYSPLAPAALLGTQELERALVRWMRACGQQPLESKRVVEIWCGMGGNLLRLVQLGFDPANLAGNELLEQRANIARSRLPASVSVYPGDACALALPDESFDIVMQFTVFTSLLDPEFQQRLADKMWTLARPGGGILWYDFTYNNPANRDVRGVPVRRIRELFPHGRLRVWRVTLAPPISRRVTRIHPALYNLLNALPLLRTHVLCWIEKPASHLTP